MTDRKIYTRKEVAVLRETVHGGSDPFCPRCDTSLEPRKIPSSTGVSYVRRRVWWICRSCGRSVVLDEPR